MVIDLILIGVGITILLVAGDFLVRGAVGIATRLGIPSLLIGLTIVAFGTSAPELVVSINAVVTGDNGIAVGNIVGSNIANVFLVLGLPALISAISLSGPGLGRHGSVMLAATAGFAFAVYGWGQLDTAIGIFFLLAIALYVVAIVVAAMRPGTAPPPVVDGDVSVSAEEAQSFKPILLTLIGLVGLPIGANLLVTSGATLAMDLGVREELVGLTLIAFGTSLPELATVIAAARKAEASVAVGNVIGSNIFNILFVGGAMGVFGTTVFSDPGTKIYDVPAMVVAALALAIPLYLRMTITRTVGILFILAYIAYIVIISVKAAPGGALL
ncbi:K+-dependent Na+/Ca+ exchanger related-protein [Parvularcula bermudensis HTCC2503]|uniref:K+-dependent Na+/Ca+ exchanger related-protein n=1 Tax=Parvularcula bermudensis (strain ATCC BAA-594 / HTCC2503 / KCTC 12087) TaxID=314260 RepID=E0TEJ1_PARBH|nr:calcium/sodium antiporter [Parvularcula bermudensis]ADM10463.1 K+-dependent Na+/Ca+ exchanger related-protein [Parvularcula bermudensis HTCC2503]